MGMMHASRQHGYGGSEVLRLGQVERPSPESSQVLVRLQVRDVDPAREAEELALRSTAATRTTFIADPYGNLCELVPEIATAADTPGDDA